MPAKPAWLRGPAETGLSRPPARRAQACPRRGVDDRIGIDAIGAVEVGDIARLAEMVDPERHQRVVGDAA